MIENTPDSDDTRRLSDFAAVSFDCYGTLIDWERGLLEQLRPFTAAHGIDAADADLLRLFAQLEGEQQRQTPGRLYRHLLADVITELARRWSVSVSADDAARFGESVGDWPPFPDTTEALRYLKQHYRLAILSNTDETLFARTQKQLGVEFDLVLTAERVGSYKPDPRNFRRLLADLDGTLGVPPDRLLHAAQSVFHDIVPAKALGLATMWVNRPAARIGGAGTAAAASPDFEVGSLEEFAARHRLEKR